MYVPSDGDGGDSPGLSNADDARFSVASSVKHLRKLSALSGTSFTDYHHYRILLHCFYDFLFELNYRKARH